MIAIVWGHPMPLDTSLRAGENAGDLARYPGFAAPCGAGVSFRNMNSRKD